MIALTLRAKSTKHHISYKTIRALLDAFMCKTFHSLSALFSFNLAAWLSSAVTSSCMYGCAQSGSGTCKVHPSIASCHFLSLGWVKNVWLPFNNNTRVVFMNTWKPAFKEQLGLRAKCRFSKKWTFFALIIWLIKYSKDGWWFSSCKQRYFVKGDVISLHPSLLACLPEK